MKKAFTLIEVNMAMLIMAGGILALVGLYALGFRENSQSVEDVDGAAIADSILSEVSKCLSHPELKWSQFDSIQTIPERGWRDYMDERNGELICLQDPRSRAKGAFDSLNVGSYGMQMPSIPGNAKWGMVVSRDEDAAIVTVAVRVSNSAKTLMAQPIYVTQVRFQGVQD